MNTLFYMILILYWKHIQHLFPDLLYSQVHNNVSTELQQQQTRYTCMYENTFLWILLNKNFIIEHEKSTSLNWKLKIKLLDYETNDNGIIVCLVFILCSVWGNSSIKKLENTKTKR